MKLITLLFWVGIASCSPIKSSLKRGPGRIIGGDNAVDGQFTFAAAIYTQTEDGRYFCGGAIISEFYVITAGQCVDGAKQFDIILGSIYLTEADQNRRNFVANSSLLHPDYSANPLNHDIGLVRLSNALTYSDYIRPVDFLPIQDLQNYEPVRALGWGQTGDDAPAPVEVLKWVLLSTLSNQECRIVFGNDVTETMVCVAGNFNEGSCIGDTGAPLVQQVSPEHILHVGISSWVSYNGCESTDPSGYTRTFTYKEWILDALGAK